MFKRRQVSSKKINIETELEEIKTDITPQTQPQQQTQVPSKSIHPHPKIQLNFPDEQPNDFPSIDNQKNRITIQNIVIESKPEPIGLIIVEDEEGIFPEQKYLTVKEDFGNGSIDSDSDSQSLDFDEEIIKRSLTRRNYQNLHLNQNPRKSRSYNSMLAKTNEPEILQALKQGLKKKKAELAELSGEVQYLQKRVTTKTTQIQKKKQTHEQLSKDFQKVRKVIEFLYYYGDRVQKRDLNKDIIYEKAMEIEEVIETKQKAKVMDFQEEGQSEGSDVYMFE